MEQRGVGRVTRIVLMPFDRTAGMQDFERVYMRTLRHVYDTEKQLVASVQAIAAAAADPDLTRVLVDIGTQSAEQAQRIESLFTTLYLEPRTEPAWVTTALLREAWEACSGRDKNGTQGCAAALLAIKRYEITLYEALLRWSEQCHLDEPLADLRRSIAEELVQASVLSEMAFEESAREAAALTFAERNVLH
jgi:ferritin-like metal-binding protein YciE